MIAVAPTQKMADVSGTAQLVALWLHGLSKTSQPCYESDIRHFVAFLLNENPDMVPLNDIRHLVKNNVETRRPSGSPFGFSSRLRRETLLQRCFTSSLRRETLLLPRGDASRTGLDSPVAYGGKPACSAGSTFASLQGL